MQANNVQILVLDFGSQYTQLIARRLREYGVYTEIVPYFEKLDSIQAKNPKGIILSGGPASVYEKDAYKPDSAIFSLGIPILGICYGMQLIAQHFGGRVIKADAQEFGKAVLEIMESYADKDFKTSSYPTLQGASQGTQAPMSFSFTLFSHSKFPQMLGAMLDLWEDSVRASHTFLNQQHIAEIKPEVKAALQSSQNIITATDKKDFLGFIGVEKNKIEMLFVASKSFRKGIGKALLKEALERYLKDYPCILVDCNEQNTQGLAFYESLGFEEIGKSAQDFAGRDFLIVHLKIDKKKLQDSLKPLHYAISPVKKEDLEEILALQKISFVEEAKRIGKMDIPPLKQDLKSIQKEFETHTFLKCTFKGKIIGSVRGYTKQETTYLSKLFVDSSYRQRGVGGALIQALCTTLSAKRYEIFTSEKSLENIALYEKLGFVEYKREKPKGFPIQAVFLQKQQQDKRFKTSALFQGVKQDSVVWMSHADKVESIPSGFVELARSGNTHYCVIADSKRKIYALQFHPEVVHSECGGQMLQNFAVGICGADTNWNMRNFAQNEIEKLRKIVYGSENVDLQNPAFITLKVAIKEKGKKQTIEKLLQIWEDSVRATQQVSEAFITHRRKEIEKDYITKAEEILIAQKAGEWLGFIAMKSNEITLLFVDSQHFGKGIGKTLLKEALNRHLYPFEKIKLNSREQALGFYQSLGFKKAGKLFLSGTLGKVTLIPLSIARKSLQKSLGLEAQDSNEGVCEKVSCAWATDKDEAARKLYENYHDDEWGEPLHEDKKLFEFLILEGFQAGLSWITILKKRESFRVAFDNFDYHKIAAYDESKIKSLMQNEGIIRNRLKIEAAIINAKAFMAVQKEFGSFDRYIWGFVEGKPIINTFESIADLPASTPLSDTIAKDLKKRGFKFVGTTIMYAFMQAIGMVNDHLTSCFKHNSPLGMQCDKILDFSQGAKKQNVSGQSDLGKKYELQEKSGDIQAEAVEMRKGGFQGGGEGSLVSLNDQADNAESALYRSNATPSKVLCAVSGGVDSSVVAALLYRAIGENLIPVFVDTGLLRKGEREAVEKMFRENLKVPLITADASALFLSRLKGVIEPEKKRKIIGETFIEVFEKEAKKHNTKGEIKFLAQGTLYPDVIESVSVKGPSKTIKSHHNVGGLPEWMKFELIEPLRELFKDEVRALGRELGMPESMLMRHPFPGPGLAIRIMGEVNKADLNLLREADSIFIDELHKQGYYDKVWQAFCVLLNVRSVGVMGDNRTYDNTICVRAVEAIDGMTATFAHLPHDFLESVSNRIINEVEGINRVVYDVTSKPPGTIEWE